MKDFFVYSMGLFYVITGLNHFISPDFYIRMIRSFLPKPREIVYLSGVIEILLGIGLFFETTRRFSAIGLILMLIAILPANINMAIHCKEWPFPPLLLYLRIPLQGILIYWAWLYI